MSESSAVSAGIANQDQVVNDFSITIGTVNGSGSQTSNLTIMRSIFKMGIPVSGKNIYPSNIQGMPTWYTIRVSKDGYLGRVPEPDIVIAMCPESFEEDVNRLPPGGVLIYDQGIRKEVGREDIIRYPLPVQKLVRASDTPRNLRDYVANMVYVGALVNFLNLDIDKVRQALEYHFSGREKPVSINYQVIQSAAEWCAANIEKVDPYRLESMEVTKKYKLVNGNEAAAIGAAFGGVQFVGWYPITPATGLADMLKVYLPKLRKDPETGRNTFAIVQAEDELAAIGMAIGAGWGGLRSMTSTSGPGLSLMAEFVGLAYFSETPLVVWDVQRVGPSTGLPTRTSQGDVIMAHYLGHGDTQNVLLFPGSAYECFEFGWKSFDLAERLQTPIFVLSDLDLGVNQWITEEFEYPDVEMDRGKVLWEEDLEELGGEWGRYLDVDGDGIPYRTVPGNKHPKSAWFARGTGHDAYARYSEDPEDFRQNMERLQKKYETARTLVPEPVIDEVEGAEIGILAYGSTDSAVQEAQDYLQDKGIPADYLRLRAIPFTSSVREFVKNHRRIYVVEMNRDGQVHKLLSLEVPEETHKLVSVAKVDGLPLEAEWILGEIINVEGK
ncbi:MAG: 2-oxoacid:acceptor oxidoreductase subunit alpha [Anaerolineales bacterium]